MERLIRYCARPVFAGERPAWLEPFQRLVYRLPKLRLGGQTALYLRPLAFLDCIAALVPPPRKHRHRYHGVLAPNSPLRPTVTAYAGLPIDIPAGQPTAPARPFPPDAATAETHPLRTRAILGRAGRLRHRTDTSATHPSPYRQTRHTPADFTGPLPAGWVCLRPGPTPAKTPKRANGHRSFSSIKRSAGNQPAQHSTPTRPLSPAQPPCAGADRTPPQGHVARLPATPFPRPTPASALFLIVIVRID